MPLADWIHKYPQVQQLLQQPDEVLEYTVDAEQTHGGATMDGRTRAMRDITAGYVLQRLHDDSTLAACWCYIDERYVPWIIGLVDGEVCGLASACEARYGVLIESHYIKLNDLPASRATFDHEAGWSEGLCLSVQHWGGMQLTFQQHEDMSSTVLLTTRESGDDMPVDVHVPYAVLNEYLACTLQDPATWVTRPRWIRNPAPHDFLCVPMTHNDGTIMQCLRPLHHSDDLRMLDAEKTRWLATVRDDVLRQVYALFASR
jgi:hypothetical protein